MSKKMIENEKVEFKSILNEKLEKVVISFLNSKTGGDIYIGVSDDGTVVGLENVDKTQLAITDRIKNNIQPTTLGLFDVFSEELDGKTVIHIVVSSGTEKPYYVNMYRINGECRYATPAGSHVQHPMNGYEHIIPTGLEIQKKLGGVSL